MPSFALMVQGVAPRRKTRTTQKVKIHHNSDNLHPNGPFMCLPEQGAILVTPEAAVTELQAQVLFVRTKTDKVSSGKLSLSYLQQLEKKVQTQ